MKRVLAAMAFALMAPAASAAIYYEFHQSTHSDIEQMPSADLIGRAVVDGSRFRIDFISGKMYPPGTYVLASDGSRMLTYVDPMSRSYTEVNAAGVAAAMGSLKIKVDNLDSKLEKLDDRPVYAGLPTDHYRLTITYDMTVTMRSVPVKQMVRTVIDKWTTSAFGDVGDTFLATSGFRTGNPELDQLIELETTKVKGFALRQVVKIITTSPVASNNKELKFAPVRTTTREFTVTAVRQVPADAQAFVVPASYRRSDPQQSSAPATQVQIISLEPGE